VDPASRAKYCRAVPLETIADVIMRMRLISNDLSPRDGVACFTRLYLAVTEAVDEAESGFASPEFLTRLDVRFANLYFGALEAPPHAWAPLLEARGRTGIAPIQFALAGMNAHINRDLPVALVKTCEELGLELCRNGREHADFLAVNALLVSTEAQVKRDFLAGDLAIADEALGEVDDAVAIWNVERARDAVWTNAQTLWSLRASPDLADAFLLALDQMVGMAGRGLLRPVSRLDASFRTKIRAWFGSVWGSLRRRSSV
jgi:Family of unknown function (DUF5995)